MKIVSAVSLGLRQTYSPEMKSDSHNYITEHSNVLHKNSHGVSYCLVAFKCLWLKAHFAPEWWTAVMSGCHPDKLVRYMGIVRSERWTPTAITNSGTIKHEGNEVKFGSLNASNLSVDFSTSGNTINQGMIGVKGIGTKVAADFQGSFTFKTIDEFIEIAPNRKNKRVMERLIKLDAFKGYHNNSRALWMWYLYRYASGQSAFRKEVIAKLRLVEGWTEQKIDAEVRRQIELYRKQFPKRKIIPSKILNWQPTVNDNIHNVMALFDEDFTIDETLDFQKEYFGYWITSPLEKYIHSGNRTIENAKFKQNNKMTIIEGIIVGTQEAITKKDTPYLKVWITDGIQRALIFIWENELSHQNLDIIAEGVGVSIPVEYDHKRNSFSLKRRENVHKLILKS